MHNIPEKWIIDKCVDKILETYLNNNCYNLEVKPFDPESGEFSVTYEGYAPHLSLVEIKVQDKGENRTFLFQVYHECAGFHTDYWPLGKTDHYLCKGEIVEYSKRDNILYECDGLAC